ncbi:MAG: hypothetical protein V4676_11220 [Bacteroidota bacterium]
MEMTAVVLHRGALAHYEVAIADNGLCYAYLQKYSGSTEDLPPRQLTLHKERRRWVADARYKDLSDELGYAIEMKARPILQDRNRESQHPAG